MNSRETIDLWNDEAAAFDEAADHGLRDPQVRAAWRTLLRSVLPEPSARVADLGSGTGTLALLLADEGYTVDGVDIAPAMLDLAREKCAGRGDVRFVEGDAATPPLEAESYDVVLCRHVLWALPDPVAVLTTWAGLLRPGGRLVLVEGLWQNEAGLSADETVAMLSAAGRDSTVTPLPEAVYWGRQITDQRYLVVS